MVFLTTEEERDVWMRAVQRPLPDNALKMVRRELCEVPKTTLRFPACCGGQLWTGATGT